MLKGPPAPGEGAGPTSIGQADGLSSPDIGCRAPLQSEIIADLRFARSVEKTTRSACDAVRLACDRMLRSEIERLVERYATLNPNTGASGGIGRASAIALARMGAQVLVH